MDEKYLKEVILPFRDQIEKLTSSIDSIYCSCKFMKIYADFNGIEECFSDPTKLSLDLTGYGTLASLSFYKHKISIGDVLVFSDPDGLSASGITFFDEKKVSANCSGWFALIKDDDIKNCEPLNHDFNRHICFGCRKNIDPHFDIIGRQFKGNCPYCNLSVMYPLSAPNAD